MGFIDYGLLPCFLAWIGMSLFLKDKKTSLTDTKRNCIECARDKAEISRDVVYPASPERWAVFHFVHYELNCSAPRISMGQVIVIFLVAITKWLMRDNFRKKGLEFKSRQPVEAGTAQGQEWEAGWSHSTTDRMPREMDVGAQCVISFSISPGH